MSGIHHWQESEKSWKSPGMAFVTSLMIHLLLFGVWQVGLKQHWWKASSAEFLTRWLPKPKIAAFKNMLTPSPSPQKAMEEIPLVFVEVDPSQAVAEPPPQARFYSAANSRAANPEPADNSTTPKITGQQERIAKTFDVPKPTAQPLQPTPAPPEKPEDPKPEENPERQRPQEQKAGDLQFAKVVPGSQKGPAKSNDTEDQPKRTRPRTIAEAQRMKGNIQGEKMRQDGGVKRRAPISSLDVRSTAFGAYDARIIQAIQQRWYSLLDSQEFTRGRSGKVVLEFRLTHDGRITHMKVLENEVGDLLAYLCQSSIVDNVPYDRWPSDMRSMVGQDYREVRFTFYYD